MKFDPTQQAAGCLLPSHHRTARPIQITSQVPALCAAIFLSTLVLCAPVRSRAVSSVSTVQSVGQSAPAIYVNDGNGGLVLVANAYLAVQEGAVYTDTCLLGYIDPINNTVIVDQNGNPLGRVVYSEN